MRFVRLVVDDFQAIRHAELTLGPGLNVLHGPNDLGKSTLATAIRAALLLPAASTEAERFIPWTGGGTPRVELVLVDARGTYHRVVKVFNPSKGTATLERSPHDGDWEPTARNREVDEKLRQLLEWGVPAPGGRGSPRGLPEPFLAHALIPTQTEVDHILHASFEGDPDDSGKLRLARALEAFALDPRFKAVLEAAQQQVDAFFTPKGQRKRGRGSPFLAAAEDVEALQKELEALKQKREETERTEARVKELSTKLLELREARAAGDAHRGALELRIRQGEARRAAEDALRTAEAELASIVDAHAALEDRARALEETKAALEAHVRVASAAEQDVTRASDALSEARERLRRVTGDEAAAQRALARAKLTEERQSLELATTKARGRLEEARRALDAATHAQAREAASVAEQRALEETRGELAKAERARAEAEETRRQLEGLRVFARLDDATKRLEASKKAADDAKAAAAKAEESRARAELVKSDVAGLSIPTPEILEGLVALERELGLAEAALGGGLSVVVKTKKPLTVDVVADGKARTLAGPSEIIEAERTVVLSLPELVDVEVIAGDAQKRRAAAALRKRWESEAVPVLALAGVESVALLVAMCRDAERKVRDAERLEADAAQAEAEAKRLRPDPKLLAELTQRRTELDAQLAGRDRAILASLFASLGPQWETKLDRREADQGAKLDGLRTRATELASRAATLEGSASALEAQARAARTTADGLITSLGEDPRALVERLTTEQTRARARLEALDAERARLDGAADEAAEGARTDEARAAEHLARAQEAHTRAAKALADAKSAVDVATGTLAAERAHVALLPRRACEDAVTERRRARDALPPSAPATTSDLERAVAEVSRLDAEVSVVNDALQAAHGALEQVGGAVVVERLEELEAALTRAKAHQRALETDADAWKLVLGALKDSESAGTKHVGRVLAEDVSARFSALTNARYGELSLDPKLATGGIESAGGVREVMALSVGTREQLATLLRLAIAESLGSAIILDDHLVQTDAPRLARLVDALGRAALQIQVIVLTCRPGDYTPAPGAISAASTIIDLVGVIERLDPTSARRGPAEPNLSDGTPVPQDRSVGIDASPARRPGRATR